MTPLAQIFLCKGCCCGQTERKHPPVPIEDFKAIWKAEKLNRTVQLTVSGCLGPCKMANVVMVMAPGQIKWFGNIQDATTYDALIAWARESHAKQSLVSLAEFLLAHEFDRFL